MQSSCHTVELPCSPVVMQSSCHGFRYPTYSTRTYQQIGTGMGTAVSDPCSHLMGQVTGHMGRSAGTNLGSNPVQHGTAFPTAGESGEKGRGGEGERRRGEREREREKE